MTEIPTDLADRLAIAEVTARYTRGVDRRDPELVRSCYHADAVDHHAGYDGPIDGFIEMLERVWADPVRAPGTQHLIGQQLIEVDGDTARVESYCINTHWDRSGQNPANNYTAVSRMIDRFERREGRWLIAERWATRDATLPHNGDRPSVNRGPTGSAGPDDPLYHVTGWPPSA
ncbi:nuclear transport factor 2 family protein [Enemella sp. A6]|uniref:nuclear transport factor 2 family protein n=1 Tax=Enemella sp. A6 TaxID=3440152 RepID=UPI003EB77D38